MKSILVIPCFNESRRINHGALKSLFDGLSALDLKTEVLFVDDGSTDDTANMLEKLTTNVSAASVLRIKKNGGKAEAVRHGLNVALGNGAQIVGYCDADFATPQKRSFDYSPLLISTLIILWSSALEFSSLGMPSVAQR